MFFHLKDVIQREPVSWSDLSSHTDTFLAARGGICGIATLAVDSHPTGPSSCWESLLPNEGVGISSARGSQLIGTINICFANAIGGKEGSRAPEIQLTCKNRYGVKGILPLPSKYLERRSNKMNKQQSNILPPRLPEAAGKGCCP